ncbi:MAG TPA: hypothetical protein VIY08_10885 [Candidatus Nitrosocosmicus sp.]
MKRYKIEGIKSINKLFVNDDYNSNNIFRSMKAIEFYIIYQVKKNASTRWEKKSLEILVLARKIIYKNGRLGDMDKDKLHE